MTMSVSLLRINHLEVGALGTNCYVLWAEDTAPVPVPGSGQEGLATVVVDPGGDESRIVRAIERAGRELSHVLLTHGHADHIAALPALLERWPNAQVVIGAGDAAMLGDAESNLSTWVGPAFAVTPRDLLRVSGGERVGGALQLEVISTPGHTPGGICFYFAPGGGNVAGPVLFSGDTLFAGSVGRCDLPGGSWETLVQSLRKLAGLPAGTEVYSGHGPKTTWSKESRSNPYVLEAMRAV